METFGRYNMIITDIIGNLDSAYDLNRIINLNDRIEGFVISVLMESKNIHFIKQVIEKIHQSSME